MPALILFLALAVAGCTFDHVRPLSPASVAATPPTVVVIGPVTHLPTGQRWAEYRPTWQDSLKADFEGGLRDWFIRNGGGQWTVAPRQVGGPGRTVVLTGTIDRLDRGNGVLRCFPGMGAGQAGVAGDFVIADPGGTRLGSFHARKTYLGGFGIGGFGLPLLCQDWVDLPLLVRRFAGTVGSEIVEWDRRSPR